jgi:toxin YoeB
MYKISLTDKALADMVFFATSQPKILVKIVQLFEATTKNPFEGIGKPEPLKHDLAGCWSRRITQEHRLVYRVETDKIVVLQLRFHY